MSPLRIAAVAALALFVLAPAAGAQTCGSFIVNGDFEAGNTGFTSAATYKASGGLTAGQYTIHTDANIVNGAYCGNDHTSGGGNMVIFDSIVGPAWSQTVNLQPGNYSLTAWVTNVVCYQSLPGPSVELRAGGTTIAGPTALPQDNATWHQLSGSFTVTAAGPVNLEVWSLVGTSNGADWALDDICLEGTVGVEDTSWGAVKSLYR